MLQYIQLSYDGISRGGIGHRRCIWWVTMKSSILFLQPLITTGIGRATAMLYATEGCSRIVIADVDAQLLESTKTEIKARHASVQVVAVTVDVRNQQSVQAMVDETIRTFGRIDYCANVAGVVRFGDTSILAAQDFDLVYEVNLRGIFYCAKAQINAMLKQNPLVARSVVRLGPSRPYKN